MEKENNAGQQERPQADQHVLSNAFHALYDPFLLFWRNADQAFMGIDDDAFLKDPELMKARQEVMERFWQKRDQNIDNYLKKHKNLSREDRAVFQSWKKVRVMEYVVFEAADTGAALYRDGCVFEVISSVQNAALSPYLPGMTKVAVLPFGGKLFCPEFSIDPDVTLDPALKDRVRELVSQSREAGHWYQTIPTDGAPQDPTKPAIPEQTVRTFACRISPRKARLVYRVIQISQTAAFDQLAAVIREEFDLEEESSYEFVLGRSVRDSLAIHLFSPEAMRKAGTYVHEPTSRLLRDAVQDLGTSFWLRYGDGENGIFRIRVQKTVICLADGFTGQENLFWKGCEAKGTIGDKTKTAKAADQKPDAVQKKKEVSRHSPKENEAVGPEFWDRFHALYNPLLLFVKNGDSKWDYIPDEIFLRIDSIFSEEYDKISEELWKNMPKYVNAYLKSAKDLAPDAQAVLRSWSNLAESDYVAVEKTKEGGSLYRDETVFEVMNDKLAACKKSDLPTVVCGIVLPFAGRLVVPCMLFYFYDLDNAAQQLARDMANQAKKAGRCYRDFPEGKAPKLSKEPPLGRELVLCYDMKVYPKGGGRQVYRQLQIACTATFDDLANAILGFFGFDWGHLYEFVFGKRIYQRGNFTIPCPQAKEGSWDYDSEDPDTTTELREYVGGRGANLLFHYDFGDDWVFQIHVNRLLGVLPQEGEDSDPTMLDLVASKGALQQYPDWDEEDDEDEDGEDPS